MKAQWLVLGMVTFVVSCGGESVTLNERVFSAQTLQLVSAGCTGFKLGSGEHAATSGGGVSSKLAVMQELDRNAVVVKVLEGPTVLTTRRYERDFFETERSDEFTASTAANDESLLLRFWGSTGGCASPTDDGPPK